MSASVTKKPGNNPGKLAPAPWTIRQTLSAETSQTKGSTPSGTSPDPKSQTASGLSSGQKLQTLSAKSSAAKSQTVSAKSDRIKNWPKEERPRERLLAEGADKHGGATNQVNNQWTQ